MKKRSLFTIGLLAVALVFTSCNDDDDEDETPPVVLGPTLSVTELNSGANEGSITIGQGDDLVFAIDAQSGAVVLNEIDIMATMDGMEIAVPTSTGGNDFPLLFLTSDAVSTFQDTVVFSENNLNVGVSSYGFTVSDDNGAISTLTFDVTVEAVNDLTLDDFSWNRTGGAPATGLAQFGLQWTSNNTVNGVVSAIVRTNDATTFVTLTEENWNTISNSANLEFAIEAAMQAGAEVPAAGYTNVSAEASNNNYDDYLGVIYQGEAYILNVQSASVATVPAGTSITIEGQFKN